MKPSGAKPQHNTVAINKAMNFAKTSEAIQAAKISLDNLEESQKRKASNDEIRGHYEAALAATRIVSIPPPDCSTKNLGWLPQEQWGGWYDSYVQPLELYFRYLQLKNKTSTRRESTFNKLVRNHFEEPDMLRPAPPTFIFGVQFSHKPGTSTAEILRTLTCATKGFAYFFGKKLGTKNVSFLSFLKSAASATDPPHIIVHDDVHFDHILVDSKTWSSLRLVINKK